MPMLPRNRSLGEVMEPADNTEGVKKISLDTIFSANSGPCSNLY